MLNLAYLGDSADELGLERALGEVEGFEGVGRGFARHVCGNAWKGQKPRM